MDFIKCVTLVGALLLLGACLPLDACDCIDIDHPQRPYCIANSVIKATFIKERTGGPTNPSNPEGRGFDSQTHQVLKGDAALLSSTFIENFMANNTCRYFLPQGGLNTTYVVAGTNRNGNVGIISCSFVRRWSDLKPKQISGLEGAYEPGCSKCGINTCYTKGCKQVKNTCTLEVYEGGDSKNQKENQACLPDENGICAWKTIQ